MPKSPPEVAGQQIAFDAFQMDIGRHRLWRGEQEAGLLRAERVLEMVHPPLRLQHLGLAE